MTLYSHKESNIRKTWLLFTLFLIVVIGLGFIFSRIYGNPGILFFAVFFSVLMSFLSYWYSDKIVLGLAKAKPVTRENARELYNVVENLCITAGLPTPKIYLINDSSPNAFAAGRNPKNSVVAVTSGLLEILDRSELEGVLSHELSHIGNRDMLLSTMVVVLVGFIALLSDIFLRSMFWRGAGSGGRDRGGQAGAILMLLGIVLALLSPLIATLIRLAISRKREFLADASGALLTRYPDGLARALEKIEKYAKPMRAVNNAMAHLWISDPSAVGLQARPRPKKTSALSKLFMTHPPIEDRVEALREISV